MKIRVKEWFLFILIALLCFVLWFELGYPQFSFLNLSINKTEALSRATEYLNSRGIDVKEYSKAVVFGVDAWADRYLQKTVGLKREEEFIKKYNYELFHWRVRFFKQFQKEEFVLTLSPGTGEILSSRHLIEDIASRASVDKDVARLRAEEFLKEFFKINLRNYDFHEEKIKRFDNRIDYSFSWERKDVYIPWKKGEGGAKLLLGATISGEEIRDFYRNYLDIPEKFRRHIENQLALGEYLFSFYFIMYILMIGWSIYIVVKRRQDIIGRFCKKWFLSLAAFLIITNLLSAFNNIQAVIMSYPTSVSFLSFLGIYSLREFINTIFLCFVFVLPGIAGESLRREVFQDKPHSSFTHYLRTTFYSRSISRSILFGYILFFIILGIQSGLFWFGQRYLGVWKEWIRLTQFSSTYLPFFGAFAISITASLGEEVTFRLFGISLGKKYLKNTALAILFTSIIWGIGHSAYAIFPVWFRSIEVSIIGIVYGFIFVKYGLIPLIVTHYLFDVFFGAAGYLLGKSNQFLFIGSVFILLIPLLFAIVCYFVNQKEDEEKIKKGTKISLSKIQKYNLDILITFVSAKKSQGYSITAIKEELIAHDWDIELVDLAVDKVFKE